MNNEQFLELLNKLNEAVAKVSDSLTKLRTNLEDSGLIPKSNPQIPFVSDLTSDEIEKSNFWRN